MQRPVILPLDRSTFAEDAIPLAMQAAKRLGAPVHLVLVHLPPPPLITGAHGIEVSPVVERELHVEEAEYLHAVAARLRDPEGVEVKAVLLDGPVASTLAGHVTAHDARMVVMSTHGRGGVSRLFLGSVADRLTRELHCPVLLVRPGMAETAPLGAAHRRILVPLDGSGLAESVIDQVLAIFGSDDTELHLLRVVPVPMVTSPMGEGFIPPQAVVDGQLEQSQEYLQRAARRLQALGFAVSVESCLGTQVARAIATAADACQPDVIAMATRGLGGFHRTVLGSVADKVLRTATVPMLIWNPPATGASSAAMR
jgi:nucleotide-binding universal stress UspA family protein